MHLGGVIVRDLSCKVSNYRANLTLDEYLKQQKVGGRGACPRAPPEKGWRGSWRHGRAPWGGRSRAHACAGSIRILAYLQCSALTHAREPAPRPPQVMGIAGVDTRAITRRLRVTGCLNGAICTDPSISGADPWRGAPTCCRSEHVGAPSGLAL